MAFMFLTIINPANEQEYKWLQDSSLKIRITTEDTLYEWEYENPNLFEYEAGSRILRGSEAKESFEQLLEVIDLSEPIISEETVDVVAEHYENPVRIDVKRIDSDRCLQTWLWKKPNEMKDPVKGN